MPEIVRNLAIAGFLQRLGILIWLGKFGLVFREGVCYNVILLRKSCGNYVRSIGLGSLKRAFSIAPIFFAYEYFMLLFSQISVLRH